MHLVRAWRAAALAVVLALPVTSRAQAPAPETPQQPPAATGGDPLARLLLMPDLSAVGSFGVSWEDATRKPRFALDEVEVGLQAVVDPYVRADVFLAFTEEEGVDVEEAFVTTLALPLSLQLRAGKLFAPFGRLNQTHPHAQEFATPPLAQARLLADESLGGAGLDVAWLAPLPWFVELHLAAQDTAPAEDDEARLTGLARLSQFLPLGEATTLGLGVSAARRDEGRGQFRDLAGVDLYLRVRPPASRSYLTASGELYARRFDGIPNVSERVATGWWTQLFARATPFLGAGLRYERAPAEEGSGDEQRLTGLVGWFPSEFQRLRLELSYDRLPTGSDGFAALLAAEFGIGAHGAHPF